MNRREEIEAPRWRLPITSTLLVGFGGLVAIAVATVMLISIRVAQENTDQLLQQTASQRLDSAIARMRVANSAVSGSRAFGHAPRISSAGV